MAPAGSSDAGGGRGRGGAPGTWAVRPEYADLVTPEDLARFDQFVRGGGTVVCLGSASTFAIAQFKLPVRNVVAGLKPEEFFLRGSLVEVTTDPTHQVMAGMPEKAAVFVDGSPIFETLEGFNGRVLATYTETGSPLLSGFLIGENICTARLPRSTCGWIRGTSCCSVSGRSGAVSRSERCACCSTRCCIRVRRPNERW